MEAANCCRASGLLLTLERKDLFQNLLEILVWRCKKKTSPVSTLILFFPNIYHIVLSHKICTNKNEMRLNDKVCKLYYIGDEKDSSVKSNRMLSAKSTPNFHHTHQFLSAENAEPKLHPNPTYAGSLSANASSSDLIREKSVKVDAFKNLLSTIEE